MLRIREENINLLPGFWDRTWKAEPAWRPGFGIDPVRYAAMSEKFVEGNRVLDVGGGRGEFLQWAAAQCQIEPWLLDTSQHAAQCAQQRSLWAVPGDCYELPFRDCYFDVVVCAELIEHLEDPARCIRELRRVCKLNGWITITVPHERSIEDKQHIWSISEADIADWFRVVELYWKHQPDWKHEPEVKRVGNHIVAHWQNGPNPSTYEAYPEAEPSVQKR